VSDGFPGASLPVPHPDGDRLYVKLRDEPGVINPVVLDVQTLSPPAGDVGATAPTDAAGAPSPTVSSATPEPP
jgi:hypothetical protein